MRPAGLNTGSTGRIAYSEPVMPSISFLGHATVLIEIDGVRVLTDPVLRSRITFLRRVVSAPPDAMSERIDVVLLSHLHHDHCDLASLAMLRDAIVVAPQGAGGYLRTRGDIPVVVELSEGETAEVAGLLITAVHADHDGSRPPFGPHARAMGFVVTGEAGTVYFAGDTDMFPGMASLPMPESDQLNVALLPVWGWGPNLGPGHMNPERAADALVLLQPVLAVPIHWGTFFPVGLQKALPGSHSVLTRPPEQFADLASTCAPDVEVIVTQPGHRVEVSQ